MREGLKRQWLWTAVSLVAFLPSAFVAFGIVAALSLSGRSDFGNLLVALVALCLPAACLFGPTAAWNFTDKGKVREAKLARAAPLLIAALLAVVILLPL